MEPKAIEFSKNFQQAMTNENHFIKIKDLTPFQWERFCVFGPYAFEYGIKWGDDGLWTIIFFEGERKYYIKMNRSEIDLSSNNTQACYDQSAIGIISEKNNKFPLNKFVSFK